MFPRPNIATLRFPSHQEMIVQFGRPHTDWEGSFGEGSPRASLEETVRRSYTSLPEEDQVPRRPTQKVRRRTDSSIRIDCIQQDGVETNLAMLLEFVLENHSNIVVLCFCGLYGTCVDCHYDVLNRFPLLFPIGYCCTLTYAVADGNTTGSKRNTFSLLGRPNWQWMRQYVPIAWR